MQRLCYSEAMEWEIGAKEILKGSLHKSILALKLHYTTPILKS
jgi:hypothetical protein